MSSPNPIKVFYRGTDADYSVFIDSEQAWKDYKKDSTVPLSDVVSIYKVFTSRVGGSEGKLDEVSKQQLENEFGTSNSEDAILKILKEGDLKNSPNVAKKGFNSQNDSKGPASDLKF